MSVKRYCDYCDNPLTDDLVGGIIVGIDKYQDHDKKTKFVACQTIARDGAQLTICVTQHKGIKDVCGGCMAAMFEETMLMLKRKEQPYA